MFVEPGKRRLKIGEYHDARDNAAIILECSNVCPFKWRKNVFGCSYCNYTSPDFGPFKNHMASHPVKSERIEFLRNSRPADTVKTDVVDLKCDLCQETIKDISTLMDHLRDKHNKPIVKKYDSGIVPYLLDNGFTCAYCGDSFDRFIKLNTHVIQHKLNFACSECGQYISSPEGLRKHILRRHVKTPRSNYRPKLSDYNDARHNASIILECSNICPFKWHRNVFRCGYCDFQSADFGPVRTHINNVHPKRLEALHYSRPTEIFKADVTHLKCELCDQSVKDMKGLMDHLTDIHQKSIKKHFGAGIIPFLLCDGLTCADCGQTFDRFMKLNIHVNEHYPNCICSQCGQAFSSENRLRAHSEQHRIKILQLKCGRCGEVFHSRSSKQKHMQTNHDVLPHKCPYCNDAFKSYAHRLLHLNKYHGKKIEFPCRMCSNIFKTASKRADHMRNIHLRDKQYSCSMCEKVYTSLTQLKKHMMKHSGERKYK